MKITVFIGSQMKGLFTGIAAELSRSHDVTVLCIDDNVRALVARIAPDLAAKCKVLSKPSPVADDAALLEECARWEEAFGEPLSLLMSNERGLGRGYITNVDSAPYVGRAYFGYEDKLRILLANIQGYEAFVSDVRPDLVLCLLQNKVFKQVCRSRGVEMWSLNHSKDGNRYFWADNEYMTSRRLKELVREHLDSGRRDDVAGQEYAKVSEADYEFARLRYGWKHALRTSARHIVLDTYAALRGTRKKNSYRMFGWVPTILRTPLNYAFFQKHGCRPEAMRGKKYIYFPLHFEPEYSLMGLSPEFSNSLEAITWLSKAAPVGWRVVIKEHPMSLGVRSQKYYNFYRQMPNVELALPDTNSWDWIKGSSVIATITGTTAQEGVVFRKPVVSFGKHQIVNELPSVDYVSTFEQTLATVRRFAALSPDDADLDRSRYALMAAIRELSFAMPGIEKQYGGVELVPELSRTAVAHLDLDGLGAAR